MSSVKEFIKEYGTLIASDINMLEVIEEEKDDTFTEITIYANRTDAGRLIGKDGNMVNALKTIISGCKAKTGRSYRVLIRTKED